MPSPPRRFPGTLVLFLSLLMIGVLAPLARPAEELHLQSAIRQQVEKSPQRGSITMPGTNRVVQGGALRPVLRRSLTSLQAR